jgi:hypothetical protein
MFIGGGVLLCLTFFLLPYGIGAIIAGALLYMAGKPLRPWPTEIKPGVSRRLAVAILIAIAVLLLGSLLTPGKHPQYKAPASVSQEPTPAAPSAKRHSAKAYTAAH